MQNHMHRADLADDQPRAVEPHAVLVLRIGDAICAALVLTSRKLVGFHA